jgi:hypothetical protein
VICVVLLLKRKILVVLAVMCLGVLCLCGEAVAAGPWWHLNVVSAPADSVGGEGQVIVEATNLGDGLAEGISNPITVKDVLPAGVTPVAIHDGGGGGEIGLNFSESHMTCGLVGQIASCRYEGLPLLPFERLIMAIEVKVAPGSGTAGNEASVAGGGATTIVSHRQLKLSDVAPSFGVENYEVMAEEEGGTPATQAGSHPFQLTSTLVLNTDAVSKVKEPFGTVTEVQPVTFTKDLSFNLPPGLVGNPTAIPQCSIYVFDLQAQDVDECPDDTVIGVATPITTNIQSNGLVPYASTTPVYNLQPSVGEPARFGFSVGLAQEPVVLDTSVRTGGDYGVTVNVSNITQVVEFLGSQVTFWGVPADPRHDAMRGIKCLNKFSAHVNEEGKLVLEELHCPVQEKPRPLLIMPTSCLGPLHTSVTGDSWEKLGVFTEPYDYAFSNLAGEPYGLDGCDRLNFDPSISVAPDGQQGSTPTGLTVGVHVPQSAGLNPGGLAEANVKDTTVALPTGVTINPAGSDGLSSCGLGEVGLESPAEVSCPESSKVGTVEIRTPLLPNPLDGAVYLAQQNANPFGSLLALYIVAFDPVSGVRVKVAGQVTPSPMNGQLVSTFKNTPELPFEDLKLHFFGGSRAPLATPNLCGTYTTTASIEPWSGNPPASSSSEFQITSGPAGGPCSNPLPFAPSLTAGSLNIQAGAFTPFTMTMSREDGNQNLDAIQLKLPPGLLGTISSVKLCGEAQANSGTCGPESLIGHTTVSVGLGGNPFTVTGGQVFVTGPYQGAPYGLSIVNPAKAGPFDLERDSSNPSQESACDCVVVRAKIEVDPITAALTVTSDPTGPYAIPQIIDGIPLQIKHVNVSVDRPNFTFNPTNCSPMSIGGSLTSSQGSVSALHVPFQVTNCATLGFKPIFKVSTTGRTSRANGASLDVKLTYPKAPFGSQTNIGKVKVNLPKRLPSRLSTLQKACPDSVFEQNPAACPADSRVGEATASTPVLPVYLQGPAYFVSHGGAKFPELVVALSGEGVTVYLHGETFINKAGITSSTFRVLPDVPIGAFELKLPQGRYSALAANGNLCNNAKLTMPTVFTGQNGIVIHQTTPVAVTNCPRHRSNARRHSNRHKAK